MSDEPKYFSCAKILYKKVINEVLKKVFTEIQKLHFVFIEEDLGCYKLKCYKNSS